MPHRETNPRCRPDQHRMHDSPATRSYDSTPKRRPESTPPLLYINDWDDAPSAYRFTITETPKTLSKTFSPIPPQSEPPLQSRRQISSDAHRWQRITTSSWRVSAQKALTPPNISRKRSGLSAKDREQQEQKNRQTSANSKHGLEKEAEEEAAVMTPPPRQSSRNWRIEPDEDDVETSPQAVCGHCTSRPSRMSSKNWRSTSNTPIVESSTHVDSSDSSRTDSRASFPSLVDYADPIFAPLALNATDEVFAFELQLQPHHVTRLIFWYMYYDLIEPPASPSAWYSKIPSWELTGWIQLGRTLGADPDANIPALHSICRTTGLDVAELRHIVTRVGSEDTMRQTETKELVEYGRAEELDDWSIAFGIKQKLEKDRRVLKKLYVQGGQCGKHWPYMQYVLLRRVDDYLRYVVCPTLNIEMATKGSRNDKLKDEDTAKGVLASYWRMMIERHVPSTWYK